MTRHDSLPRPGGQKGETMDNATCSAKKEPISNVVLESARNLSVMVENTASSIINRFARVCVQEPGTADCDKKPIGRVYPEYFDELSKALESIRRSVEALEDMMKRCEL